MQPSQSSSLPRVLGPWIATAIVVGTVIGSGVFKKGRNVADDVPEIGLAMAVWALGGVLTLLGALALAEVAVLFPRAGGNYVFLREGYGRMAGFLWGWVEFWIIRSASIGALATMFTDSFHDILKQTYYPNENVEVLPFSARAAFTVGVIVVLAAVNARGTRLGGGVQLALTLLKVFSLLFIISLPFAVYAYHAEPTLPPRRDNLSPFWPDHWGGVNWSGLGVALVGVLWAYHGWMNIAPVAGEIREPQRNIPLSLFAGVFILIVLYCGANLAYYYVVPHELVVAKVDNKLSDTPLATEFCRGLLGPFGAIIASAIIMTSVFGSLNGNLLVGPRLLYAMAHDRLAPQVLGRVHVKFQTPLPATVALAGLSCLQVVVLGVLLQSDLPLFDTGEFTADGQPIKNSPFDVLTNFAIFGSVTFETLAVASIFMFRWRIPATVANRPYRCWGYPVVPLLYIAIMAAVLVNFFVNPKQRWEAMVGLGFIAIGAVLYRTCLREKKA
ncbi:MAG: amino acid permease [Gemmataceae bacterium]|nr:amino acid permease [Gemmata sp.]MDW8197499.1 amino acid permease [Gemmataceae bacterium]